jgi:hypothetical protein
VPISDLLGKRARTASGVEVATPTVRSFFRALEVFQGEIAGVRSASRKIPGTLSLDLAIAPFIATPEDGRLQYVLGDLVDRPGIDVVGAARSIAPMVLPLARLIDGMLSDPDADVLLEDDDVDAAVLMILGCSERLKIDPMLVMDWPLGLFLDATTAFSRPPKSGGGDGPAPDLSAMGIPTTEAA